MSSYILKLVRPLRNLPTRVAFWTLKRAMRKDPGYAWAWHSNIAMAAYDAGGVTPLDANRGAAAFMGICFKIDMKQNAAFRHLLGKYGVTA